MATKKPAPKKAVKPAKKAAKQAPKKATPAKKAAQGKKVVAKKTAPAKKAVPAKKVVAKKVVPVKKAAKAKPVPAKKAVAKHVTPKKAAPVKHAPAPAVKVISKPKVEVKKVTPLPTKPLKKQPEPLKEVKVPKTSVKTSVAYKPQYTPLEKRTDNQRSNEPIVRYSDAELTDFRDLINRKMEAAKKELAYLQGLITRKDEMGGDESDNRYITMEDGGMSMEREQLSQMASRQIQYIDHLEKAIMRIENKTYGICRVTGKLIDKARLRAVPHATLSLEAKLGLVKPMASNNE
ncbi:RNA polymerase-binding transcription factor DksA [mine drainage metagenome]|uniref:RNA polymerase-binding transcription factor DksA n=1 Tax=mine drainage metagenome TaxID=410659 RepID=A0A1J5SSF1_9ZZZZ